MTDRREFLKLSVAGAFAPALPFAPARVEKPIVISTWNHGIPANEAAWEILSRGGRALDAVEAGVRVPEADPSSMSVGYGGLPDVTGRVTLDACIMDEHGNCGSVAFLEHIMHPISVARRVMEQTQHVMLVGEGAFEFAIAQGFEGQNLLTPEAERKWREWQEEGGVVAPANINVENHDTIGMLALDDAGNMSGACTTSGAAFKLHGRVGDSPIIGAGLFVDNEVGGACATGWGEAVMRTVGSHLVVELMRQGRTPAEACRHAVERIAKKFEGYEDVQVGFLALDKQGRFGAYAIHSEFDFAVYDRTEGNRLLPSPSML